MTSSRHIALAIGLVLSTSHAQAQSTFEVDLGLDRVSRGGDALNSGGPPLRELPEYDQGHLGLSFTTQTQSGLQFGFSQRTERTSAPVFISGVIPSGDTMEANTLTMLQVGQNFGQTYLGAMAGRGTLEFTPSNVAQNADFSVLGLEGEHGITDRFGLGLQLGTINSAAADPETLDNGTFLATHATYDLANLPLLFRAQVSLAHGDQDTDSGSGPDMVDILGAGISVEWKPNFGDSLTEATTLYAGYDWFEIVEGRNVGANQTVSHGQVSFGLRIALGGPSKTRTLRTPNFGQWLGSVAAVD